MNLRKILGHLFTIAVFAIICYCLTSSIAARSIMGIILAVISLGATIVFFCLLPKLYQQQNEEESSEV